MSDGWPGDELREEAGKMVDEGMKKDERIRQLEQDLDESQRLHQFAVEYGLELKKDIRSLLKLVSSPPWPIPPDWHYSLTDAQTKEIIGVISSIREKVK